MTKKHTLSLLTFGFFSVQLLISQNNQRLSGISKDYTVNDKNEIDFIRLDKSAPVYETNAEAFLNNAILSNSVKVKKFKSDADELGFSHSRYHLTYNNIPVHGAQLITHARNGKLISVNGDLNGINKPVNNISIPEAKALKAALNKVDAKKYKWEDKAGEAQLRKAFNNPSFSYYPKAETIIYTKENKSFYAYKFAIYADIPLYGANVIVDAQSGAILAEENLIHTADVPATAITKFSGVQSFTVDNVSAGLYILRETGRGSGIETYDLNTATVTSSAVDYTNTSVAWTNTTTIDQIGTDAHWGAEMTYDYYFNVHSFNSINNAGFKLISYSDYGVGYNNAFWNGSYMTYGSGGGGGFVGLDICGHEVTHGLTSMNAGLIYQNESGALNESYSDIFGACIEYYAKPLTFNWLIGETVGGIRSMSNPNSMGDPDTYNGTNWYTGTGDNGGVHTNSGVSDFWFYLLSTGGTGVNDIANSYTVTGLGMTDASRIAFRSLVNYYGPNTNYASARNLSIQAAADLFGPCSNEVYQTKSAWYAVGVGPSPSGTATPVANFTSISSSTCALPFNVTFNNATVGGDSYVWDFGDGSSVSTATNPAHSYTANGTYNVKLKSTSSCAATPDSIIKNAYIIINAPSASTGTDDSRCGTGTVNLNASGSGMQYWYTSTTTTGSPVFIGSNYTPTLTNTTTYYVVNTFTNPAIFGGPASTTIGTGANFPGTTAYDSLTVFQPCKLKTVVVSAASTASRTIQLRNSMNTVLQSTVVLIPAGVSTVTLNFNLTPGYGYRLGLGGGTAMLYRNNSGVSFPYNIGGIVTITGSSQGPNYHFFFYNWEVEPDDCKSTPIAVTGTILPGSGLSINSASTICSGQSANLIASGVTTYTWDTGANTSSIVVSPSVTTSYTVSSNTPSCGLLSQVTTVSVNPTPVVSMSVTGNAPCASDSLIVLSATPSGGIFTGTGVSGNNFNPNIGPGTYTIMYYYTDPIGGCSASASKVINVGACVGINELNNSAHFKIYPNPANDFIILSMDKEADVLFKVFDATGKLLLSKQLNGKTNRIDINSLAKGIYFIEAQDANKNTYRQKIVKQ